MRLLILSALGLALAGCAAIGGNLIPATPVAEIPLGQYDVRVFAAMAPTLSRGGEVIAAVLYTKPGGPPIEVWSTSNAWLWERRVGRGTGNEHLTLVKSAANYQPVALTSRDGAIIGYAVVHRPGVQATLETLGSRTLLLLATREFIDPDYIRPDNNGRARARH